MKKAIQFISIFCLCLSIISIPVYAANTSVIFNYSPTVYQPETPLIPATGIDLSYKFIIIIFLVIFIAILLLIFLKKRKK